ncbi:MAG: hypothetical protein CME62_04735 [Halobacteriovoraceae bacterium]|nr:hypothetical protein [Halobacteriovoraceae bacterium]|tara:strand:- start:11526 stop:12389 length:864 start_codon:yes stop_codon:yes gene_type:complete
MDQGRKMSNIFNYQTLKVKLDKATRTLYIKLDNDHIDNPLNVETLFELESLLAWMTNRIEIHSVFIDSSSDIFSTGYNRTVLKKLDVKKLAKFTSKLQKINQAIMLLPQTFVIDLQMGASNIASELATACDIRIANRACEISFDHAQLGIIACSGGIAQLGQIVGHGNAKNWLLTGGKIGFQKLISTGYVFEGYTMADREIVRKKILTDIYTQAPVQRIQTKMALSENIREEVESKLANESKIAKAAMVSEDWKDENLNNPMPANSMKTAVKLSIVKDNDQDQDLPN